MDGLISPTFFCSATPWPPFEANIMSELFVLASPPSRGLADDVLITQNLLVFETPAPSGSECNVSRTNDTNPRTELLV